MSHTLGHIPYNLERHLSDKEWQNEYCVKTVHHAEEEVRFYFDLTFLEFGKEGLFLFVFTINDGEGFLELLILILVGGLVHLIKNISTNPT